MCSPVFKFRLKQGNINLNTVRRFYWLYKTWIALFYTSGRYLIPFQRNIFLYIFRLTVKVVCSSETSVSTYQTPQFITQCTTICLALSLRYCFILFIVFMWWTWHVARMADERNTYRVLVGKPEGRRSLRRPKHSWKCNRVSKFVLKKPVGRVGTGLIWLRIAKSDEFLSRCQWHLRLRKIRRTCRLAEHPSASRAGL